MNVRTLLSGLLVFAVACLAWVGPASADGHAAGEVKHSVFIAGPSFTGILGEDGEPAWTAPRKGARDGFVLGGGNVLIAYADEVVEFDKDKNKVWTYKLDKSNGEISTAVRLENGNTLVTELGENARLLEVSKDGAIKVEVKLQPDTDNVHMQTRMARKLANGNYLVPHLFAYAVKEYTPEGEVVATFHTDTEHFGGRDTKHWPFTAIRTPGGPNRPFGTTVVGCTYGNRVVEFDQDGEVIWELTNDDVGGIIKDACGVQRLPNGNTVVACYGQTEKTGVKLFEVTPEKEIVWKYSGPHRVHHFQVLTTNGEPVDGAPMK